MRQLTPAGQQAVNDVAQRHGFSAEAVRSMLEAVVNGNGTMAQFNHPEFAGSGQWMRGGMTMVSDMFNDQLKGRIDGLCRELSRLVASEPRLAGGGSFQSQSQGGPGSAQQQSGSGPIGPVSLFVPPAAGGFDSWWPAELGRPNSTGAQNDVRYAYFVDARRLAIEVGGVVTVYDTLDHRIGGFSQQQSWGGSLTFSSQHGVVDIASLPVVPAGGSTRPAPATPEAPISQEAVRPARVASDAPARPTPPASETPKWQEAVRPSSPASDASVRPEPVRTAPVTRETDVLATIEKLAELHGRGILSDEEFAAKKTELLARL